MAISIASGWIERTNTFILIQYLCCQIHFIRENIAHKLIKPKLFNCKSKQLAFHPEKF